MAAETAKERSSLDSLQTPQDKLAWLVDGVFERGTAEDPFEKLVQMINHRSQIILLERSRQLGHCVCNYEYLSLKNQCITVKKLVQQLSEQFPGPKDRKSDRDHFAEEAQAFLENVDNEKWMDQFFVLEHTSKGKSTGDDATSQHPEVGIDYMSKTTSTLPTTKAGNTSKIARPQRVGRAKSSPGQMDKLRDKMSQLRQKLSPRRMSSVL